MSREGQGYPCYQHDMMMMIDICFGLSFFYIQLSLSVRLFESKSDVLYTKVLSVPLFLNELQVICLHTVKCFSLRVRVDLRVITIKRRCPWCNGYRRRNWARQHEFKSWTDCISHSTNTLGKGMNPIILPPAMGK